MFAVGVLAFLFVDVFEHAFGIVEEGVNGLRAHEQGIGHVLWLLLLMGGVALYSTRLAREVGSQLDFVTEHYLPGYAALARADVRTVEQALALRRLIIVYLETPEDRAAIERYEAAFFEKGRETDAEVASMRELYLRRRDLVCEALRAIGVQVRPPRATIYVWAPVPEGFPGSEAYCTHVLEHAAVVLSPGAIYGPAGEGWFRISLTTPDDRLLEAVHRLGALAA